MNEETCHENDAENTKDSQKLAPAASGEQQFTIEGASCASCVTKIETAIKQISGVSSAEMNCGR